MGAQDITGTKSAGNTIDESWYNDFRSALAGALLPRSGSTGAVESGSDLGSATYPWGTLYADILNVDGQIIDFSSLTSSTNSITSGAVRSTSDFPDFIRADGAAAEFDVLGAATNLVVNINGTSVTVSTDITETSLTVAPSSNNTATINDAGLTDQESSKWQGEDGTTITITSAGTEITNRVGQWAVFKKDTEYFLAYIKSSTELTNAYRGFFFDSAGAPINRVTLANSDSISIMSTAWVFIENDAATVDVTYTTPIYAAAAPSSPATGDYWYDSSNEVWKRYNGSDFVQINRTLIGIAVIDETNCVASRSFNFNRTFVAHQPIKLDYISATEIKPVNQEFDLNVYGVAVQNRFTQYVWDIASDLESGQSEGASTTYYAYVAQDGERILSDIKPYDQRGELKGWYHPYNAWRCVGYIFNDGSSNFDAVTLFTYHNDNALELTKRGLANLEAFQDFTSSADQLPYFDGENSGAITPITSFARTLLDDTSALATRTTLGIATVTEDLLDPELERVVAIFGGFAGATAPASIDFAVDTTNYMETLVYLNDVSFTSGTGAPIMYIDLSTDGGSTYDVTYDLGTENGVAASEMEALIKIGPKIGQLSQDVTIKVSSIVEWTAPVTETFEFNDGSTDAVNHIRIRAINFVSTMGGGSVTYKQLGKNSFTL